MLEAEGLERETHPPRVADSAPHLLDANLTLGDGLLVGLLRTASVPPHVCSRHVLRPPSTWRASDSRCSTLRCRARGRSARRSSAAAARPTPPEPCCVDLSSQGSW